MAFNIEIPKELQHLPKDKRGYPVPYFVSWIDGQPEFRYLDIHRLQMIMDRKVCHICGVKLPKDYAYVITGPIGMGNRVTTDAPMHRVCAEFSLRACPHLFLQKAERRANDELGKAVTAVPDPILVPGKPTEMYLVKACKFKKHLIDGRPLLRYTFHSCEKYIYIDNKLTKEHGKSI